MTMTWQPESIFSDALNGYGLHSKLKNTFPFQYFFVSEFLSFVLFPTLWKDSPQKVLGSSVSLVSIVFLSSFLKLHFVIRLAFQPLAAIVGTVITNIGVHLSGSLNKGTSPQEGILVTTLLNTEDLNLVGATHCFTHLNDHQAAEM